jgi:nucleotide-binding universal stress UspA family protein
MERILVALDFSSDSMRGIRYISRVLCGADPVHVILFHAIATVSPDRLRHEEVVRIECKHEEQPELRGYFWTSEDEQRMNNVFDVARNLLVEAGFSPDRISSHFTIQSSDVSLVISREAADLDCNTIVIARRQLSRVKGFLTGRTSTSVIRQVRGITVWIVDN